MIASEWICKKNKKKTLIVDKKNLDRYSEIPTSFNSNRIKKDNLQNYFKNNKFSGHPYSKNHMENCPAI